MSDSNHGGDGRGSLRDRVPSIDPPAALGHRVQRTLESRGLVTPLAPAMHLTRRRAVWATRAALLAVGVVIGMFVRGTWGGTRPAASDGKPGQYALLLYGVPPEDTGA